MTIKALISGTGNPADEALSRIHDIDCIIAYQGLEDLGAEVSVIGNWLLLSKEEIASYDVCVGGVNECRNALFKLGVRGYDIPCYPEELQVFMHSRPETMTLNDIVKRIPKLKAPKFVKPVKPKRFSAFITSDTDAMDRLYNVDTNEQVYVVDLINFTSEWRMYVKEGTIIRVCNYAGDPLTFPDKSAMDTMACALKGTCCAAIDVGIVDGTTCLVEVNDFYALGNYGLFPEEYAQMLILRWKQLTNKG